MSSFKMYQNLLNGAQSKEKSLTLISRDSRPIISNTKLASLNKSIIKYNAMRNGPDKEAMLELIKHMVSVKLNKSTKADTKESLKRWLEENNLSLVVARPTFSPRLFDQNKSQNKDQVKTTHTVLTTPSKNKF